MKVWSDGKIVEIMDVYFSYSTLSILAQLSLRHPNMLIRCKSENTYSLVPLFKLDFGVKECSELNLPP